MAEFEDYYEILQVHFLAEPEVIKKAFAALAYKYHPDRNPGADAAARMQKINIAYAILGDTNKRKLYDAVWIRNKQPARPHEDKPRPAVEPGTIKFIDVIPNEIQRSSFLILNTGGSYKKIWFSTPYSWVRVANYFSLTDLDELPLKVEVEARGEEWDRNYVEFIKVKLDDEETLVKIELITQQQPVNRPQSALRQKLAKRRSTVWLQWTIGLALVAITALALMKLMLPLSEAEVNVSDATISQGTAPPPAPAAPALLSPSWQPVSRLEFKQLDLFPIADFTAAIDPFPDGAQAFNGIGFSMSKSIVMTRCAAAYLPNEGVLTLDIVHPKEVFILINTTAAYLEFLDKQVGKITLKFDNGVTEETELIVGQNIREYTMDNTAAIRAVYDPANQMVWQGGENNRFAIDMLTIPIDPRNQVSSLKQISITDTSETTANSIDPGLIVWGLTIAHSE